MPGIDEETLEVGAGEGFETGGGADLDDLKDGPTGTGGSLVVEDEEEPNTSNGSNNANDSLNAISQSVWYEKVYEDEENAETASHLVM